MTALAFLLECGAVAGLAATVFSVVPSIAGRLVRAFGQRLRPPVRADLLALSMLLPGIGVVALLLASAAPSLGALLTGTADHCASHAHHLHLCVVHAAGLRPPLALLGAAAIAFTIFRTTSLVNRLLRMRRLVAEVERLGTTGLGAYPVVSVPGAPSLCHAVGALRGRILLSAGLQSQLTSDELAAAIAHEGAHLRRRDPLVALLLGGASLFLPPWVARSLLSDWRAAAEESCDEAAARKVADRTSVASALVKIARLQRRTETDALAPAFGAVSLEQRVRRLLSGGWSGTTAAFALWLLLASASAAVFLALSTADHLHHAVETLLHLIS